MTCEQIDCGNFIRQPGSMCPEIETSDCDHNSSMATPEYQDASSSEESHSTAPGNTPLRDDEIAIVQENLKSWMEGDKPQKRSVLRKISDTIHRLGPNKTLKTHQWVTKKKVNVFFGLEAYMAQIMFVGNSALALQQFPHSLLKEVGDLWPEMECTRGDHEAEERANKEVVREIWPQIRECGVHREISEGGGQADKKDVCRAMGGGRKDCKGVE